ncbi:MAG TPA: oxidoreductase, partial [Gammaproteobacteria bacterium]|nr:oxidoreductase [Gammaproteobacteria bacterium]
MSAWTPDRIPDLSGKTILVTGANSGLGLESTRLLAGRGAQVVMACRSRDKAGAAIRSIEAKQPDAELVFMELDLADLESVRSFVDAFEQRFPALDVLLNNAGLMAPPLMHTRQGFEIQFGTNHLGHFALTGLLLERLEAAGEPRVVCVSSTAHRIGRLDFDNLDARKGYSRWRFYGQSKLANLMFALELHRRLRERGSRIRALAAHPGYAATNLQGYVPGGSLFNALMAQSQVRGCYPGVFAATAPEAESG